MLLVSLPALAFDWRAAAWDGAGFWVIEDEDRVYARRLDPATGFTDCVLSWPGRYPAVASAGGHTLVVWERGDGEAIEGVRLGSACADAAPRTLADEAGRQERAVVTGSGTGWVVAWSDPRGSGVARVGSDGEVGAARIVEGRSPVLGPSRLAVEVGDATRVIALDAEGRPGATILERGGTRAHAFVGETWLHATVLGEGRMLLPSGPAAPAMPCASVIGPNMWAAALGEGAVVACGAYGDHPAGRLVRVTPAGGTSAFGTFAPPRPGDMHRAYPVVTGGGHVLVLHEEGVTLLDARGVVSGAYAFPPLPLLRDHVPFGDPAWAERYWELRASLLERLPGHTLERPTLDAPTDRWSDPGTGSAELRPDGRGSAGWANARVELRAPGVRIVRRVGRDDALEVALGVGRGDALEVALPALVDVDGYQQMVSVPGAPREFLARLAGDPTSLRAALKVRILAELAAVVRFGGARRIAGACHEERIGPGFEDAPPEMRMICMPMPMPPKDTAALIVAARARATARLAVVDARYREFWTALGPVRGWLDGL